MNDRKYMIIGKIKKLLILGEFKIIKIISNKLYKINWNKKNINYWKRIIKTNIFILMYIYDTYESFLKEKIHLQNNDDISDINCIFLKRI